MPSDWAAKFASWAAPPGTTEQDKIDNTERAIRTALSKSATLSVRNDIAVFAQGSYRNRTNVRAESDVDIAVRCRGVMFYTLPTGATPEQFNLKPSTYSFNQFRTDVGAALESHFGAAAVSAGRKAFDIHENTYRISADVVPVFEYRDYSKSEVVIGTSFLCDGKVTINYPDQHYENGVAKNADTGKRFKAIARILKRLKFELAAQGVKSAQGLPSYAIESMVWNVKKQNFNLGGLRDDLRGVIATLWNGLDDAQIYPQWAEVNGLKPLFHESQAWSLEQAKAFLIDVWQYAELSEDD